MVFSRCLRRASYFFSCGVQGCRLLSFKSCKKITDSIRKMSTQPKKYLLWFAQEHVNFRASDVECVASIFGIQLEYKTKVGDVPYCIVELASEKDALLLASRCISLKAVIELWGRAETRDELHKSVQQTPKEIMQQHFGKEKTFRLTVETFCKSLSQKEKVERIESFNYLPIEGDVNLKNPDVTYYLLEYFGQDSNCIPDNPYELFFGRLVSDGQRSLITKLSLKTRHFLGNTSMDAQLSLLMANQAKIVPGSFVYDPFVGSGSLLVAAAQFGGYVCGSDIDFLMIHGKTRPVRPNQKKRDKGESIKSNMRQYNLSSQYLDILVADFARPLWRPDIRFDAILTDPPYGVREAIARVGSWLGPDIKPIAEEHLANHVPAKVEYSLQELMTDLLEFSANHLTLGGRLVYWLPIVREEYDEEKSLPHHDCLRLISNCEQVLSCHSSRLLLCMEKIKEPTSKEKTPPTIVTGKTKFRDRYFGGRPSDLKEQVDLVDTK